MTLFIDASALVAIIAGENDAEALAVAMRQDSDPLWSAMSCWETVIALRRIKGVSFAEARREVEAVALAMRFRLVDIGDTERRLALDAHDTFGKGRHDARLNMGDCFAYACTKSNGARLLYKGDDFIHTDIA